MGMAEYIKRMDTFSDEMCEGIDCGVCPFYNKAGGNDCQVVAFLRSIPAADVRPVVRGRCEQFQYMPPPAWIPVTERLPEENGFYLCLYKHKHPGGVAMDEGLSIQQWYNGRWNLNEIYAVTHWMPLPEPPMAEEGE